MMIRRLAVLAAFAGVAAAQVALAIAYQNRGTWWHYLLHQLIGWGVGLSVAAGLMVWRRGLVVPPVLAAVAGQLVSIGPDLMFRFLRMPHEPSMDLYLGHISIHRGPSPVLVALAVFLLGGWAWIAAAARRPRLALGTALVAITLLTGACLAAAPIPTQLSDMLLP